MSSSHNLILNLFGSIISIEPPSNLIQLRQKISDNFIFKKTDADELILSYDKDSKTMHIETEEDYKSFLDSNINQIYIDTCQNKEIYQENFSKLQEDKSNDEKKLNELKKQNEEYKKLLSTKFISQKQEIIEITKQIQELFSKRKKLVQYIKIEKGKILRLKKNNDKSIADLEKKLGIKNSKVNKTENIINIYKKRRNRKLKKYFTKKENNLYNQKFYSISHEKIKNPSIKNPPDSSFPGINLKNINRIKFKRKTSPLSGDEALREKKIINTNENKNNLNPFNDENEEAKGQKQKFVKIAEIICNTIKSINDIANDKTQNKNVSVTPEKKEKKDKNIKLKEKEKEKKEIQEKPQSERNEELKNKNAENKKETINNKAQKNERVLLSNKEKTKNSKKTEEKKIQKRNSKDNNINKKVDSIIKNNNNKK